MKQRDEEKPLVATRAPVTIEQIEMMLRITANAVVHGGEVYAPLLYRLQKELEIAKKSDPVAMAREILKAAQQREAENRTAENSNSQCAKPCAL